MMEVNVGQPPRTSILTLTELKAKLVAKISEMSDGDFAQIMQSPLALEVVRDLTFGDRFAFALKRTAEGTYSLTEFRPKSA